MICEYGVQWSAVTVYMSRVLLARRMRALSSGEA